MIVCQVINIITKASSKHSRTGGLADVIEFLGVQLGRFVSLEGRKNWQEESFILSLSGESGVN